MSQSTPTPVLYCANHPDRETSLRCNRCEKPICPDCAVLTPTGYRCKECVRSQQKVFETAQWWDYPVALLIAGGLSFLGSLVASKLGFFTLFIAPIAGVIIAEAVRTVISRRRSRRLYQMVAAAVALGSLPLLAISLLNLAFSGVQGSVSINIILPLIFQGLYTVMVTSTAYYRLSGIALSI